nr:MAG TPA_asm: ribonuclease [Bacteriophage sp.]
MEPVFSYSLYFISLIFRLIDVFIYIFVNYFICYNLCGIFP